MKLIIDIPEEDYIRICDEPCTKLGIAVQNGKPLDNELQEIRQEIKSWFREPARYIPNYDAYKRFIEIIDNHCCMPDHGEKR